VLPQVTAEMLGMFLRHSAYSTFVE